MNSPTSGVGEFDPQNDTVNAPIAPLFQFEYAWRRVGADEADQERNGSKQLAANGLGRLRETNSGWSPE